MSMAVENSAVHVDSSGREGSETTNLTSATISNEFARVVVEVIVTDNGCRLSVRDVRHGTEVVLDPIELEALTRLTPDGVEILVNPSFDGFASFRRSQLRLTRNGNGRTSTPK